MMSDEEVENREQLEEMDDSEMKEEHEQIEEVGEESGDEKEDIPEKETKKRDREEGEERSPSPVEKKKSRRDRDDDKDRNRERDDKKDKDRKRDRKERDRDDKDREKDRRSRGEKDHDRDRDRDRDRKRDRRDRSRSTDRKRRDKGRDRDHRGNDLEEGEVLETAPAPVKREPTARDLERMRQMEEEMKKESQEDEDRPVWSLTKAQQEKASRQCPYLDTINRPVLDFDFEKLCSVSLSHLNVYACLVCGKYFQGRGTSTHAYTHSLDTDHRVFLNLQTLKFYCLPDNYEIIDPSLDDIKYILKPTYTKKLIDSLDCWSRQARAYDNTSYFPGVVGLNNIKANDYENVVLHALSHVTPLRDYFLQEENYASIKRPPGDKLELLSKRFGELVRKLWNPKAFKAHVSPHEMLQAIVLTSGKKFQFIEQGDAADFMNFLLNTLHISLNGTQKTTSSVIYKTFRGRMRQFTRKVLPVDATEEQKAALLETEEYKEDIKEIPFLYLALDLPAAPLYRDEQMQNIIPQVPLQTLLMKFNGETEKEYKTHNENFMKRFELLRLPEYLIITYKRFLKNQFFVEKNPTIVNFPISNVDLYDSLSAESKTQHKYTTYDLIANVVHDGKPKDGKYGTGSNNSEESRYRIQLMHKGSGKWFQMDDLHVTDILPQMITLAESYIQIWKLNRTKTREQRMNEEAEEMGDTPHQPKDSASTTTAAANGANGSTPMDIFG